MELGFDSSHPSHSFIGIHTIHEGTLLASKSLVIPFIYLYLFGACLTGAALDIMIQTLLHFSIFSGALHFTGEKFNYSRCHVKDKNATIFVTCLSRTV